MVSSHIPTKGKLGSGLWQTVKGLFFSGVASGGTEIQKTLSLEYVVKVSIKKPLSFSYQVFGEVVHVISETYVSASVRTATIIGESRTCELSATGRRCILEVII